MENFRGALESCESLAQRILPGLRYYEQLAWDCTDFCHFKGICCNSYNNIDTKYDVNKLYYLLL